MGRYYMKQLGFHAETFLSLWFAGYIMLRTVAIFGQLYVFTHIEVGKTVGLFGASSLILINLAGFFFLGEVLPLRAYIAIMLAITAIVILAFSK